jgi:RNA-dependent RNA polymerase
MHLTNVVVFSTKGDRPQFNKMSSGDLDGDKYIIIWNKDVLNFVTPDKI